MPTPTLTHEKIKPHRLLMEQQLIGRALSSVPAALEITDILMPTNFKNEFCSRVFTLIRRGKASLNLDIISLRKQYLESYGEEGAYQLVKLIEIAEPAPSLLQLCLCLLEEDIREKFCRLFERYEKDCAREELFEESAIWKQCHDYMSHRGNDVFDAVSKLESYLRGNFPDQLDEYEELRKGIPPMIDRIKARKGTRKFLDDLCQLTAEDLGPQQNECVRILSDWLVKAISSAKLPEGFYETLTQLNAKWNEQ